MQQPVPYTRAAIKLIRDGASAKDLGWSESRYDTVCRSHGIEREKPRPQAVAAPSDRPPHELDFRHKSGEVIRAGIIVSLPSMQARAFKPLYDRLVLNDDSFMSGAEIGELIACVPRSAYRTFDRLNKRLAPLRCRIESKGGNLGGFRLRMDT